MERGGAGRGCLQDRRTPSPSAFDSHFKRRGSAKEVCRIDEPHRLLFLIAISKGRVGAKEVHERDEPHRGSVFDSHFKRKSGAKRACEDDEPHRGSAFDSPGLASVASYPGLIYCVEHNAVGVALFLISSLSIGKVAQRMFAELTNPIGVLLLIAQGCQTIVQATLG